jgi:exo-1,4-beta-D-glucosaminidase
VFPDPYYGMNLRQIPGTTYPIGGIFANCRWRRTALTAAAGGIARSLRRRLQRMRRAPVAALRRHQLSRRRLAERPQDRRSTKVAGAYRTYDFDVTEF